MEFLSDDWLAAMDAAARRRPVPADDPWADVSLVVEQVVTGGPRWRLVIDRGQCSVQPLTADADPGTEPDVRLTSDRATAAAIASGQRPALEAFIAGDLVLGGDVRSLLEHRVAVEVLGDLFAEVKAGTEF
ncbi:MAG TPA: SCP2 sterol-binding domain-containing protein [Acidimicrobiales bacterium]|nr:SCP2 sterol-binding domain-containing protein [Acidimicrobiales bacterium]